MKATLNVGLKASSSDKVFSDDEALAAVRKLFNVFDFRFAESATERTLIARVDCDDWWGTHAFALSLLLDQDCIAISFGQFGQLIGPRAEAWGEFNPDYFIPLYE
jgi:hypothetical protein